MSQSMWMAPLALVILAGSSPDQTTPAPAGPAAGQVERGRQVYAQQKCQACHSIENVGNRRYPLDGVGDKLSPDDIRKWIVSPRVMNPRVTKRAFDKLPREDLDALVAYLEQLRRRR